MTIYYKDAYINETSVTAGPFLIDGPLKEKFDNVYTDFYDKEKTFEDCEVNELVKTINSLLRKGNYNNKDISLLISADLSNQIVISNLAANKVGITYFGIYNACASFCESLILASSLLYNRDDKVICTTSAHNLTSERQFKAPVEYGMPKPEYSTFTASAATACIVSHKKEGVRIESGTIGKVIDLGIKDAFDMGSAMSPAAAYTLNKHLKDTNRDISYYDLILTGDLGMYGKKIFKEFCLKEYGLKLNNYDDAACLIYNNKDSRVCAGGSGPSCLPTYVFCEIIPKMKKKKIKRVLLLATGALFSTTSVNQKKSIPCICHAVSLEAI